jgi:hypothetical protein
MNILISISDPWDLGESLGWQPLRGQLLKVLDTEHGGRALIKLDEPVSQRGSVCRYLVASPRHEGNDIASVQAGRKVSSSFICIPDQDAEAADALITKSWRGGGVAFIGDLELESTGS